MTKAKWTVDESHSVVEFSVKHLMISTVKGNFNSFSAEIEADPSNLTDAAIEFTIDANSIDTRKEDRDNHLRSADFFDVEKYPQIKFKATNIVKESADNYDVQGDFEMHGVSKPVTFAVVFEGQAGDVAGFSANTEINRADFGLTWNSTLETGGVLVSEKVKINLDLQLHKS
jgi:polyisoprenoid-binding protein YceI